jgi:uncharacterized membrane protein YuzA (DUF378 family)
MVEERLEKVQRIAHLIGIILLIFGGLNYGALVLFGTTIVQKLVGFGLAARIIYAAIALSAVALMFHRDTYLPFLGPAVMPACNLLAERIPEGATLSVKARVPPGAKVLYWAAEPSTEGLDKVNDWREAYAQFKNAGVTVADVRGHAYLKVRPPQTYSVPFKGRLDPHVHYRVCQQDGMMGRIETLFLTGAGAAAGDASVAAPYSMFMQNMF